MPRAASNFSTAFHKPRLPACFKSSVGVADNQRWLISNQEHIRIIDAILMENIDSACDLLRSHLAVSYEEAVKTLMQMD